MKAFRDCLKRLVGNKLIQGWLTFLSLQATHQKLSVLESSEIHVMSWTNEEKWSFQGSSQE